VLGFSRPRIVVLGGGFAGLNCAALLSAALPDAGITIVSDDDRFTYRPAAIHVPFGSRPDAIARRIRPRTASRNVSLLKERVYEIEPSRKIVVTGGRVIDYDFLVVATGAGSSPREIDGLTDNAINLWTLGDMVRLGQRLRRLGVDAGNGYRQQVVLTVAQGAECPWPVYEMAFMLDTWLRRHRLRGLVGIALATHEDVHLAQFGPAMHERVVRELEERSIDAYLGGFIHRVRHDRVVLRSRRRLPFDLLIAMPPHVASTKYESLPSNERHFLRVDAATCAVREHPDVFAVGDCNELPLKQAVMAVAQASVVAARFNGKPMVEEVRYGKELAERIFRVTSVIRNISLVFIILLGGVSILLISNTIRLSIYARRREVEIMKLVGATNWFIRWPFIIEGLAVGLVGAVLALIFVTLGTNFVMDRIRGALMFLTVPASAVSVVQLAVILLGVGALIGAVGSGLGLRRFLNV